MELDVILKLFLFNFLFFDKLSLKTICHQNLTYFSSSSLATISLKMLQELPLEILIEICLYDFQIGFKLHQTIKKLFLNSDIHKNHFPSENWYRISQDNLTYIRINNQLKLHSFNDQPFVVTDINRTKIEDGKITTKVSGKIWFKFGLVHRGNDLPAYIDDEEKVWWKFGQIHRDKDLPAVITLYGKYWYKNGMRHRDNNLPALEMNDGSKE